MHKFLIHITGLLLITCSAYGQMDEKEARCLLSGANSIEEIPVPGTGKVDVHRLVVTPLYLDFDGTRVLDLQQVTLSEKDTMPNWLLKVPTGEVLSYRNDTSITLVRSFGVDSILCFRSAQLQLPTNCSLEEVQAALEQAVETVKSEEDWIKFLQDGKRLKNVDPNSALSWHQLNDLRTEFEQEMARHKAGDIFSYSFSYDQKTTYHMIVYKVETERYFKRNVLAGIYVPLN